MRHNPPDTRPARRRDSFARWAGRISRVGLLVTVAGILPVVGCRQFNAITGKDNKGDLLEAELRTREREILELRAENQHLKQLTDIYQRQGFPDVTGVVSGPVIAPPVGHSSGTLVRAVSLGTGTGGRDDDGYPGDETLQVVIAPKDDDGTAVKVPGRVFVTAAEVTAEGLKVPIGKWEVTPEQLKKTWKGGFLSSGYFVPLQWDQPPTTEKVRVTVRLTTADGRSYEADKDVTVKPLPGLTPRIGQPGVVVPQVEMVPGLPSPPSAVLPAPGFQSDSTILPPPRSVEDSPAKLRPAVPK
jgi:hypothetical protein